MRYFRFIFIFLFFVNFSYAQCGLCGAVAPLNNCDIVKSDIILTTPDRIELIFDSFGEYKGGMTLNGSSIIHIKIPSIGPPDPPPPGTCQWRLRMIVSNNGWGVPTDWETMAPYGGAGTGITPALDLLEFRVSNVCNTPQNSGVWQQFAPLTCSVIDVINSGVLTPAGTCNPALQTNGAGSYLTNYNEYSFTIDYRLRPYDPVLGFIYRPGRYELHIQFCLQEM